MCQETRKGSLFLWGDMTIKGIRRLLGNKADGISDEQLMQEFELAEMFANLLFDDLLHSARQLEASHVTCNNKPTNG